MKIPTTFNDLYDAASLSYDEGNAVISLADKALVEAWIKYLYGGKQPYLHTGDHKYALRIILDREPTYREVQDSSMSGSRNIDAARIKMGAGEAPPDGWATWSDSQRLYSVLVHLNKITRGSKIFDGDMEDPNPEKTAALLAAWSGGTAPAPPPPPPLPPPTEPPVVAPPGQPTVLTGTLSFKDSDRTRTFAIALTEVK